MAEPVRGEIWYAQLSPVRRHEQGGRRPVLIVSDDQFNQSGAGLVFAVPLTTTMRRGIAWHIAVDPPEGGLARPSIALCEQLRSISKERFFNRIGAVDSATLMEVERRIAALLSIKSEFN